MLISEFYQFVDKKFEKEFISSIIFDENKISLIHAKLLLHYCCFDLKNDVKITLLDL